MPEQIPTRFFNIKVKVQNVGNNETSGVVQVYAGKVERGENDYERVLIGFARSSILDINKSEEVEVHCRLDPVSHRNDGAREFELQDGKYNIWVPQYEGDSAEPAVVRIPAVKWGVKKA